MSSIIDLTFFFCFLGYFHSFGVQRAVTVALIIDLEQFAEFKFVDPSEKDPFTIARLIVKEFIDLPIFINLLMLTVLLFG